MTRTVSLRDDSGISLILALGIIFMLGVIVGSFVLFVTRSDKTNATPAMSGTLSTVAGTTAAAPGTMMSGTVTVPSTQPAITAVTSSPEQATELVEATLLSVTDGDTIRVRTVEGSDEALRLIGINAPESGECFSAESTKALTALLSTRPLSLLSDISDRDQFNRLLRYVFVGDLFVNAELVHSGHAVARRYEPDTAMAEVLEEAQQEAIDAGRGLWNQSACGPANAALIEIVALAYNPPGDDNQVLDEEWVALRNAGDSDVSLGGWAIKDESASHKFAFPPSFVLRPGGQVVIHTGCGNNGPEHLYWCETGSAVWNNSGDTVFVLDPSGNIVTFLAYDATRPSDELDDLPPAGRG